jgi:benzoyl-CoA reductase/2-hydroxyglutaryl-CoA dehydratase subunit BcrC/BadD/HgdB
MADYKIQQRRDTADRLAREFGADGIIYEQVKYCDFWAFERPLASHILTEEYGWPTLSIDRSYNVHNSGQLRTRFQAFVEALEIKRIKSQNKEKQEVPV